MGIIICWFQVYLGKYLNVWVSKIKAALDVKLQSRAIATTCLLALAVQDLPVPPLRWTLDSSAIAPLIPASPFLAPCSGLLRIHICSVTLILLHLCQKYINWCMDFSAAFSQ